MKRLSFDQAERWLAEQSALYCKSERQAQSLLKLSTGQYRVLLEAALQERGFLKENNAQVSESSD
jgi:hypothetical protein